MKKIKLLKELIKEIKHEPNVIDLIEEFKQELDDISPLKKHPVNRTRWVLADMVTPNDYNPNSVAKKEMQLLHTSISHDGYTQPIVTIYDEDMCKFIIVDGFHRYYTAIANKDIMDSVHGYLPIVVIDKSINDRMASTIRHNRARGMHSITGMSSMVFEMLENGWSDEEICNELGMSAEEILKLKHITGFSYLFKDAEYNKAWESKRQIKLKIQYKNENS